VSAGTAPLAAIVLVVEIDDRLRLGSWHRSFGDGR
jgi:hypothetical protein